MRPYIVLLFSFLSFTAVAVGFSMASIIKQAEVIKVNAVTAATSSMIEVSTTIRGFAANDPYQIKKLSVPKATFMTRFKAGFTEGGIKGLVKRNAWYAAWAASIAAAGWAIDELSDQVTQKPVGYQPGVFYHLGDTGTYYNSPASTAVDSCKKGFPYNSSYEYSHVETGWGGNYGMCIGQLKTNPSSKSPMYRIYKVNCSSNPGNTQDSCTKPGIPNVPVVDDAVYDSLITEMLKDPVAAAQAFMVPDAWPYPYPQIFPDTVPYIPGVTESDQELLDLYAQGLLQSTNPNAAHYVSPEKLAEIAALAGQLAQAVSPDGQVSALNDQLKQPLTQSQLEEALKKNREAAAEAAAKEAAELQAGAAAALEPAQSALSKMAEDNTWLENQIRDSATANPPSDTANLLQWTWPSGRCQPFPFNLSIKAGTARADDGGAFCDFYNSVAHPLIFWFLNMLTGLMVFVMWSRTMTQIVGGR